LKPKNDKEECDNCPGVKLEQRADDSVEVISKRLKIYREQSDPIITHMKDSGLVLSFEPKRGIKDYEIIRDKVYEFLKERN
jgi:adenylate kinase family enzyme